MDWTAIEVASRNLRSSFQTFPRFCGDDPNPRVNVEGYRDFRRRIANVQKKSHVPPECFETALSLCIEDFLGGHVAKTVSSAISRNKPMTQILGELDARFKGDYTLGVRLMELYPGDYFSDRNISHSVSGNKTGLWSEFLDVIRGMTLDEFVVELMKCQCSGKETLQSIAALPKSIDPHDFMRLMTDAESVRLNSLTNTMKDIPVVQTSAVVTSSHKRGDMKRNRISKLNSGPGKAFKLSAYWTRILKAKGVNVKDMANMKLAKQRISKGECLYCGAKGHTVLQCPVPAVVDGCLPTA